MTTVQYFNNIFRNYIRKIDTKISWLRQFSNDKLLKLVNIIA